MLVEVEMDEQIPEIKEISTPNNDKIFELTEKTVKENIIQNFGQPPILLGVYTPGKLGATNELREAQLYYSLITEDDRDTIERVFNSFLEKTAFGFSEMQIKTIIPLETEKKLKQNGESDNV